MSPVCCSCAERGKARGGTGGLGAYGLEAVGVVADGLAGDPGLAGDGVEADCRGVVGDPAVCCDRPARRVWVARLWAAATRCWELSDCIGRPSIAWCMVCLDAVDHSVEVCRGLIPSTRCPRCAAENEVDPLASHE